MRSSVNNQKRYDRETGPSSMEFRNAKMYRKRNLNYRDTETKISRYVFQAYESDVNDPRSLPISRFIGIYAISVFICVISFNRYLSELVSLFARLTSFP